MISNYPFRLDVYWQESGTLRVAAYKHGLYTFGPDRWRWLEGDSALEGEMLMGSLAPRTGGANRYGAGVRDAPRLTVADFNAYLERREGPWRLEPVRFDAMTDPEVTP